MPEASATSAAPTPAASATSAAPTPPVSTPGELWAEVQDAARAAGLSAVGVVGADADEVTRTILETRAAEGLAADMAFTYRNPARSTDVRRSIPWARSLVVGALRYADVLPEPDPRRPSVRIARYAVADRYTELRTALAAAAAPLRSAGARATVLADDNALVDRALAYRAGLGWFGRNANLLLPGQGSWFVLGAVVTDAVLPLVAEPVPDGCGPCRRCEPSCPTGAIVGPATIDARRCLAWLLQAAGPIPIEFREAVGDRLYGCDDCQTACPPNRRHGGVPASAPVAPSGPTEAAEQHDLLGSVSIEWILTATDTELLEHLGRFYLAGRNPNLLRRNAIVALGNLAAAGGASTGSGRGAAAELASRLLPVYAGGSESMLAEHARWAMARAGISGIHRVGASGRGDDIGGRMQP